MNPIQRIQVRRPEKDSMSQPTEIALFILSSLLAFMAFQAVVTGWADRWIESMFVYLGVL